MPLHFITFVFGVLLGGFLMWHRTKAYRLETKRMVDLCKANNRAIELLFEKHERGDRLQPWDFPSKSALG